MWFQSFIAWAVKRWRASASPEASTWVWLSSGPGEVLSQCMAVAEKPKLTLSGATEGS